MSSAHQLVTELKLALKEAGLTYRDVASHLGISEASVKRSFSKENFSLSRMEKILLLVGLDIGELVQRVSRRRDYLTELSDAQEQALVGDPAFFVITFLVLNRWSFDQIIAGYNFSEREVERALLRLDRLKIIELLPFNRYRLLTARNFAWRRNGSVNRFFKESVMPEFFASEFREHNDELRFVGGMLTRDSIEIIVDGVQKLARQFAELSDQATQQPREEKVGCSAIFAFRPFEYSIFAERRRSNRQSD